MSDEDEAEDYRIAYNAGVADERQRIREIVKAMGRSIRQVDMLAFINNLCGRCGGSGVDPEHEGICGECGRV